MENEQDLSKSVGANVRSLRQAAGMTLEELSKRLEKQGHPIGLTTLSKLERGDRGIGVDDLASLAGALEVSTDRLLLPPGLATRARIAELIGEFLKAMQARADAVAKIDEQLAQFAKTLREAAAADEDVRVAVLEFLESRLPESHWAADLAALLTQQPPS